MYVLSHRLGGIAGNHFNGPYRVIDGVCSFSESRVHGVGVKETVWAFGGGIKHDCNVNLVFEIY